jgi:redox-sensitive bicupin YhaK (pirin superfamily)
VHGFQLWANLPSTLKMTAPRYQDIAARDIPEVVEEDGTRVRIVCGSYSGKTGPVEGVAADPRYLDVRVLPGIRKSFPVEPSRNAFAYVFEGSGVFGGASAPDGPGAAGNRSLVLFGAGDDVAIAAGDTGVRFLLVSGRPIAEPVAWHGPIVMNTKEEIRQAMAELQNGTFIKRR